MRREIFQPSGEKLRHWLALVGHGEWPLGRENHHLIERQPEGVGDAGIEVRDGELVFHHHGTSLVRGAADCATLHAAAEQCAGKCFGIVIAAFVAIDRGGAAEFRRHDDQCVLLHPPGMQIREQTGERLVEDLAQLGHPDEIRSVRVPAA